MGGFNQCASPNRSRVRSQVGKLNVCTKIIGTEYVFVLTSVLILPKKSGITVATLEKLSLDELIH